MIERPRKFLTPALEGLMRNDIVIEVQTVNGIRFKFWGGQRWIFQKSNWPGCQTYLWHSFHVQYISSHQIQAQGADPCGCPSPSGVLSAPTRHYTFKGKKRTDKLGCKILGICTGTNKFMEADPDPNIRWAKIEWVDYGLQKKSWHIQLLLRCWVHLQWHLLN